MPYTNNVPQGNQTIAASQPLIQANFGFIQTDLQVDHVFNGNNSPQPEGTHLQAQMKNRADPVSLPANIDGIYYVGNGQAKFYNSVGASFITKSITGSNKTIGNASFIDIADAVLPLNSSGTVYVWDGAALAYLGSFNFVTNASTGQQIPGTNSSSPSNFGLALLAGGGLNVRARIAGGSSTASFAIIYTTVA